MSKIDEYIAKRNKKDPKFASDFREENQRLEVAVEIRNLRDNLGMSQREFANLVHKPQSTIARIESGEVSTSINTLEDIAEATHQKLTIKFEPVTTK